MNFSCRGCPSEGATRGLHPGASVLEVPDKLKLTYTYQSSTIRSYLSVYENVPEHLLTEADLCTANLALRGAYALLTFIKIVLRLEKAPIIFILKTRSVILYLLQ